jgi:protein-S-isoprenylcysteine O-methyltransferase Ste14
MVGALLFLYFKTPTDFELSPWTIFKTTLLVLAGHGLRMATVGVRAFQSSGRNRSHQVAEQLNTSGMYSIMRHPLYAANLLIWLGWASLLQSNVLWFLFFGVFSFYYAFIMHAEEAFLSRKFKEEYSIWKNKTPIVGLAFWKYKKAAGNFSWRIVVKNEYPGWISSFATAWMFAVVLTLKRGLWHWSENGHLIVYWALVITAFGLTFKGLKKYTTVFYEMD